MKTIKLKSLPQEGGPDFEYAQIIRQVVNLVDPQKGGLSVEDMKKRLRIIDALDKAKTSLDLEDADYDTLAGLVSGFRWAIVSPLIVEFCEDVAAAKDKK